MAIPKSFTLVNHDWTVVYDTELPKKILGECRYEKAEIALRPGLSSSVEEHTFYHELVHVMAHALGWDKFNAHEGKVDSLAGMLHQFMQTRKFNS